MSDLLGLTLFLIYMGIGFGVASWSKNTSKTDIFGDEISWFLVFIWPAILVGRIVFKLLKKFN